MAGRAGLFLFLSLIESAGITRGAKLKSRSFGRLLSNPQNMKGIRPASTALR
jgi:hypothetical protein